MKRVGFFLAFIFATAAHAHVLLTTTYTVSGPLGVVACSASHATATSWAPITNAGSLTGVTITYSLGTATFSGGVDSTWVTASCAPGYTLQLSFITGTWTLTISDGGQQTLVAFGTMAGVTLSTALSNYQTANVHQFADDADQFLTVTGAGLLTTALGTQPDVWASGDN